MERCDNTKGTTGRNTAVKSEAARAPLVLAIDIGTSSLRTVLFDREGRTVEGSGARRDLEVLVESDGAAECDPDGILESIWDCLDETLAKAEKRAGEIACVASCSFVGNVFGLDARGKPVTSVMIYSDTRSEPDAVKLRKQLDEEATRQRTGCRFHSSYLPARFRWLERVRPDVLKMASRWVSIGEYMDLKLFGQARISYSAASWTGMLDRRKLVWDGPLLDALPVSAETFSPLVDACDSLSGLQSPFAERWPALKGIPWYPTIGDGAAANIGSGAVGPDRAALTVGTTGAVRAILPGDVDHVPDGLWCYRVDGKRSLLGGALSEGGSVFAWMNDTLRLGPPESIETALSKMPPDGHGLTVLPFFSGERSPGWKGSARATVHGLSLAVKPLDILRAGMEAVAFRVAIVFRLLKTMLPGPPEVVAGGGALLRSPCWLQIMADALESPVRVCEAPEASARGTALLALESLGVLDDLSKAPDILGDTYRPDEESSAAYRKATARQVELYNLLLKEE